MAIQEKERRGRKFTRREMLFILSGSLLGLATLDLSSFLLRDFSSHFDPEKFKGYEPAYPVPKELIGINLNAPFLWRQVDSAKTMEAAKENAAQFNAKTLRVFVNDDFEPQLGDYQTEVLEKIERLTAMFPLQVDLFDCYPLLHAQKTNLVYASIPLSSPYLIQKDGATLARRQLAFFTDKSLRNFFLARVKKIVGRLHQNPQIIAWSVANEPIVPVETRNEGKRILTEWYSEVLGTIREIDPKRPIVSGLADPTSVDEVALKRTGLSANTIHIYPSLVSSTDDTLYSYRNQERRVLPLICQEIGLPSRVASFSLTSIRDELSSLFFGHFLEEFTSIGLWRLSFEGDQHQDGYEMIPGKLPKTLAVLKTWDKILQLRS